MPHIEIDDILACPADKPILIAGPTASGKSDLALRISQTSGGVIVNADALQVYENWRVLSARPSVADEAAAPHRLYGHVAWDATYSVGHWLREVAEILAGPERVIIVGGTGLYFTALTQGLAEIPPTPADIRHTADTLLATQGIDALLADLDADTRAAIDCRNPMRVQRAWEVLQTTGQSIRVWQAQTPAPLLPIDHCYPILVDIDKNYLNQRIEKRFSQMVQMGALAEVRENLDRWDPSLLSSKAIGAPELMAHIKGEIDLDAACALATIATRQFAKRQRTWFRSKMKLWHRFAPFS